MVKYYVDLTRPKKTEPAAYPQNWYHGGYHEFNDLNNAREDAIKMYLRGWHSGSSYRVASTFGKERIEGVSIYKGSFKSTFYGAVVRYNNKFYWVLNNTTIRKKYLLNMDGTIKDTKSDQKEWDFGVKGDWRPFQG